MGDQKVISRRNFAALLTAALCLTSCRGEVSDEEAISAQAYVDQDIKDQALANAQLTEVDYPNCTEIWAVDHPTSCGKKVFAQALRECGFRAARWQGQRSTLLGESAGDSWLKTAGYESVMPSDKRLERMIDTSRPSTREDVAVLVGEGTRDIVIYECSLKDFRLTEVSRIIRKTNTIP